MAEAPNRLEAEPVPTLTPAKQGERPILIGPQMKPYRFEVDIVSVCYYRRKEWASCAILLSTTFILDKEMLASASIHLSAETDDENLKSSIDISNHFPDQEELVEVLRGSDMKTTSLTPNISAGGSIATVQLSGVGTSRVLMATNVRRTISLVGVRKAKRTDEFPEIEWIFEDQFGVFYPKQTKTLIIVTARTPVTEFPFSLRLKHPPMYVHVHSKGFFRSWFKKRALPPASWIFKLIGKYNHEVAEEALLETQTADRSKVPRHFGLRNAATHWERSHMQNGQAV